ncbi:MAG: ribonuclease HIII [Candidatus Margulisbacteria bacterium GWF2_38_17]|nr:MAG: ribonuclease HIII [Candidatus Margulisbacteria bacterium GWD2_39_127]OGI04038.1 MAG: ribonuclease HIII [Candidatus Margulisbacteria bacterium GWF2_38_17]OGI11989.1 MAG: ribonuclease HIII [Candidatus Margulisbacteria bacterium GWE2_39_32]
MNDLLPIIGTDESGKGDFFGPLVVAGVYCDERIAKILEILGVKDCKLTSDKQVLELAIKIEQICPYAIIAIGNPKYNEMYEKSRNLNSIMGWAHATTIEKVLEKQPCDTVLSDKFADDAVIKSRLKEKGKQVKLIQRTKAESHIAVAAASVIARARFLNTLSAYEKQYGFEFGKGGASPKVIATGKQFIKEQGKENLNQVAKMHFKTLESIL